MALRRWLLIRRAGRGRAGMLHAVQRRWTGRAGGSAESTTSA